jgi:D-glycero-alpha-D-manno-heptose-7-phosphate kinase
VRIETSAPTRIDLAGGTIDIWPLYLFHPGALTINAAISVRARARVESRADSRIVLRSEDTGVTVEATTRRRCGTRRACDCCRCWPRSSARAGSR